VQLGAPGLIELEFGIIKRTHDLVPNAYQTAPTGMYVTFVVPDVDEVYKKAQEMGAGVILKPRNEFYGQRLFLVLDPADSLIDVCTPWREQDK
jgi:predicted enzyme related to lactoylglutathione lyase